MKNIKITNGNGVLQTFTNVDSLIVKSTEDSDVAFIDGDNKEDVANKVTSLSSESTDIQYPSAKCVYDAINGQYELIEEITLTEDVDSISRSQDTHGVNYNFSKLKIRFNANGAALTAQMLIIPKINNITIGDNISISNSSTSGKGELTVWIDGGYIDNYCWGSSYGNNSVCTLSKSICNQGLLEANSITSFNLTKKSTQVFPAGAKISIYAIRN